MAAFPSPLPTTTSSTATTCPFLHIESKLYFVRSRNNRNTSLKISCNSDQNHNNSSKSKGQPSTGKLDRRTMLVGLGGLYGVARHASKSDTANAAEPPNKKTAAGEFPVILNRVIRTAVPRPKKSRSKKEKEDEEEVLVIDGIELEKDMFVKFDVYINDEDDPVSRPDNTEFAGSFVNVPHKHTKHGKKTKTRLRLGLTDLLEDLDVDGDDTVVVTLVPRSGADNVTVGGINIEFDG